MLQAFGRVPCNELLCRSSSSNCNKHACHVLVILTVQMPSFICSSHWLCAVASPSNDERITWVIYPYSMQTGCSTHGAVLVLRAHSLTVVVLWQVVAMQGSCQMLCQMQCVYTFSHIQPNIVQQTGERLTVDRVPHADGNAPVRAFNCRSIVSTCSASFSSQ